MARNIVDGPDFTIANGADTSNVIGVEALAGARGINIFAPAGAEGTITVETSPDAVTFFTQYSGGDAIEVPAGGGRAIDFVGWKAMRLKSSIVQTGAAVFQSTLVEEN